MTDVQFLDSSTQCTWKHLSFDDFMQLKGESYRQVANRNTYYFERDSKPFFIKVHQGIGFYEWLKCRLNGKSAICGAENEFSALKKLSSLGIHAAKPIAFGKRGMIPIWQQSYIVMDAILPSASLETLLTHQSRWFHDAKSRRLLILELAHITRLLHQANCYHQDYYICHFLMHESSLNNAKPELYLIDLHRMLILKKPNQRLQIKDLAGLYFSLLTSPITQKDIFRFIEAYTLQPASTALRKNLSFWQTIEKRALKLYKKDQS